MMDAIKLLQPFCDDGSSRYCLSAPFVAGGYLWATDSRIIVRVKADEPNSAAPDSGKFPNVVGLWEREWPEDLPKFIPLRPPQPILGLRECWDCLCKECDGEGEVDFKYCAACKGRGFTKKCMTCHGEREVVVEHFEQFGPVYLAFELTQKMRGLPGVKVAFPESEEAAENRVLFIFRGGEGIVMPTVSCERPPDATGHGRVHKGRCLSCGRPVKTEKV